MLWWAKQKVILCLLFTKMHLFIIGRGRCYSLLSIDVKGAELNGYIMQLRETPNQQLSFNFHYKAIFFYLLKARMLHKVNSKSEHSQIAQIQTIFDL